MTHNNSSNICMDTDMYVRYLRAFKFSLKNNHVVKNDLIAISKIVIHILCDSILKINFYFYATHYFKYHLNSSTIIISIYF